MQFYHVKNWERFQHYKDRNPPWIKLHFELLSSMDWVVLDDASRVLAIACMLIASRNNGRVPSDPNYMRRVAYLNRLPKFKPLIDCGFLEIPQADASTMQADARPETYSNKDIDKTEKERKGRGSRFALQDPPDEWVEFCQTQRPDLEIGKTFDGFRDYWISKTGNNATKLDWFATWRNWVRNQNTTKGKENGKSTWKSEGQRLAEKYRKNAELEAQGADGGDTEPALRIAETVRED